MRIVLVLSVFVLLGGTLARAKNAPRHEQDDQWEVELFRGGVDRELAAPNQFAALHRFVGSLSPGQRSSVRDLLLQAREPAERFYLLKAFAAGAPWDEVVQYATEMRGVAEAEIIRRSSPRGAGELPQQWEFSCAPAVVQFALGEADPWFAWQLNKDAAIARGVWASSGMRGRQQRTWLEQYGGVATPRGDRTGRGITLQELLNDKLSRALGVTYLCQQVTDLNAALSTIAQHLRDGYDVPLCLSWASPESATGSENHFVLVLAVRGPAAAWEFEIYDPATGKTGWVSADALRRNTLSPIYNGYQRVTHFYEPRAGR